MPTGYGSDYEDEVRMAPNGTLPREQRFGDPNNERLKQQLINHQRDHGRGPPFGMQQPVQGASPIPGLLVFSTSDVILVCLLLECQSHTPVSIFKN